MATKKRNEMSREDLLKQEKSIKVLTGMLAGALFALLVAGTALALKQGFNTFIIIPFALLPILFLNIKNLKEIKKELNSRRDVL